MPIVKSRTWPNSWNSVSASPTEMCVCPPGAGFGNIVTSIVSTGGNRPSSPAGGASTTSMNPTVPAIFPGLSHGSQRQVPSTSPVASSTRTSVRTSSCQPRPPSASSTRIPNTSRARRNRPSATASTARYGRIASGSVPSAADIAPMARNWSQGMNASPPSSASSVAWQASMNASAARREGPARSSRIASAAATEPTDEIDVRRAAHDSNPASCATCRRTSNSSRIGSSVVARPRSYSRRQNTSRRSRRRTWVRNASRVW